jgi:hypothetical protein
VERSSFTRLAGETQGEVEPKMNTQIRKNLLPARKRPRKQP